LDHLLTLLFGLLSLLFGLLPLLFGVLFRLLGFLNPGFDFVARLTERLPLEEDGDRQHADKDGVDATPRYRVCHRSRVVVDGEPLDQPEDAVLAGDVADGNAEW